MHRVEPVDNKYVCFQLFFFTRKKIYLFSLYSSDWIHPSEPLDFHEIVPVQSNSRLRYHNLPSDVQARLLADINQELIDYELQNMLIDLSGQTVADRVNLLN